jgi:hypothetical protein
MTDDRKLRTDAWWSPLTEEQQAQIYDRMRRFPWHTWGAWISEEFAIPIPSRARLYGFREWFADHETEYLLTQRIKDRDALERELAQAGAADPVMLANVLGNDVVAARARGDDQAVDRAVRLYTAVARVSGGTEELKLKIKAEERAQAELEIERKKLEIRVQEAEAKLAKARETIAAAASGAGKGGITPETLKTIEEALNLL